MKYIGQKGNYDESFATQADLNSGEKIDTGGIKNGAITRSKLNSTVIEELNNKANIDGSYELLTSGNTYQLISTVGVEDNAPYVFRTSGGSVDIGDREELNAVVGGTVAWNQLAALDSTKWSKSYAAISFSGEKTIITATDSGTSRIKTVRFAIIPNHKHLVLGTFIGADSNLEHSGISIGIYSGTNNNTYSVRVSIAMGTNTDTSINNVWDSGANGNYFGFTFPTAGTTAEYAAFDKLQVIDLTQMFGSAIADYVYTLESGTAGAGVAWLKKYGWFTKPYYPYAAASLQSVKTSAHRTIGFNAFDKNASDVKTGKYLDSNGALQTMASTNVTGYIPVVGGQTYYWGQVFTNDVSRYYFWYDASKNIISGGKPYTANTRTAPANACYLRCSVATNYWESFNVNLSWDGERDGEYEPYEEHTYALNDVELRGIPKLDASNNLYYDGDEYVSNGTVTRRYNTITLDGVTSGRKFTGVYGSTSNGYAVYWSDVLNKRTKVLCDKFVYSNLGYTKMPLYSFIGSSGATTTWSFILPSTVTTLAEANQWLVSNNVHIVYDLSTPTTESADPYQQTQIVDDFGTEEFVDAAVEANERDVAIPVGHETFYQNNLKAKLEMAPNSPDGDGVYVVQQTNGENEYIPLVIPVELPTFPSNDGTYVFKITVSGGTVTKAWVEEV